MVSVLTFVFLGLIIFMIILALMSIVIVPQRNAFIMERLGKYRATLEAGFHVLTPFIDNVSYRHSLKEQAIDVAPQTCITKDNIAITVDGILYLQVMDPQKASYGINDYQFAVIQIAQTTMRSIIGKMELDRSFEERELINSAIVQAVDKASDPWGIKITRYEIKNIVPPQSIKDAMEKQMRAEREKRALIAESEGDKQAKIIELRGKNRKSLNIPRVKNKNGLTRRKDAPLKLKEWLQRPPKELEKLPVLLVKRAEKKPLICVSLSNILSNLESWPNATIR